MASRLRNCDTGFWVFRNFSGEKQREILVGCDKTATLGNVCSKKLSKRGKEKNWGGIGETGERKMNKCQEILRPSTSLGTQDDITFTHLPSPHFLTLFPSILHLLLTYPYHLPPVLLSNIRSLNFGKSDFPSLKMTIDLFLSLLYRRRRAGKKLSVVGYQLSV